jgi:hypothetical protein
MWILQKVPDPTGSGSGSGSGSTTLLEKMYLLYLFLTIVKRDVKFHNHC